MTRRIAVALAAMLLVGACSGQATSQPTPTPTLTATQAATHTLIANSPAPTPTPTAMPSPTPTELPLAPGELNVTFASLIADLQAGGTALDKYRPIDAATLRADYQPYISDPQVIGARVIRNNNLLELCLTDSAEDQIGDCAFVLSQALQIKAEFPNNLNVQLFSSDAARMVANNKVFAAGTQARNILIQQLQATAAAS